MLPEKVKTLQKFDFDVATHRVSDLSDSIEGHVTLNGHLNRKPRIMAKRSFAELRDTNGDLVQVLVDPDVAGPELVGIMDQCGPEDTVSVTGKVLKKHKRNEDDQDCYEIVVTKLNVLNHADPEAARLDRLKHTNPAGLPPQYRYLQLRTPAFQHALRLRSQAANYIRQRLAENHDFVEIDTPLLFKLTPEGAREFLVPTRSANSFYALPQSPQQYKQILMSSGFSRYFQLAKCFRDEDLRADRQPEFMQVDLEMAYVSSLQQVMDVVTDVVRGVWQDVGGKSAYRVGEDGYLRKASDGFGKLSYIDALTRFGIDKPDLRSSLEFVDLSAFFTTASKADEFGVVEACVLRGAGKPLKVLSDARLYPRRKPMVIPIKSEEDANVWFEKIVSGGGLKLAEGFDEAKLKETLGLKKDDILAVGSRAKFPYENPTPLGKFRQLAIEHYPGRWTRQIKHDSGKIESILDSSVVVGTWVVDFPLFSPKENAASGGDYPIYDYTSLEATHHPFTMAKSEDYDLLETDPLKVHGEHYDLVINGVEVGGGSRRIHDPELQTYVFEKILKIANHQQLFGHLLKALGFGCPPHAGLALGFDRLCAMMVGSSSIRDVIAFPKNQSGVDPVVESPTDVGESTLKEYHIRTLEKQ